MPGFLSLCDKKLEFTTSEYSALFSVRIIRYYFYRAILAKAYQQNHITWATTL